MTANSRYLPVAASYALTVKQPWADLIMAGIKDVENRTWAVPSTLPQWMRCPCGNSRYAPGQEAHHLCYFTPDGPFPFRLWIHAAKAQDDIGDIVEARRIGGDDVLDELMYQGGYGVLLGSVTVTGCHHADQCYAPMGGKVEEGTDHRFCSPWADPDGYHWKLADPHRLSDPVPVRGRQRLWTLPDDVIAAANRVTAV